MLLILLVTLAALNAGTGYHISKLTMDLWIIALPKSETVIPSLEYTNSWLLIGKVCRFIADKSFTGRMQSL